MPSYLMRGVVNLDTLVDNDPLGRKALKAEEVVVVIYNSFGRRLVGDENTRKQSHHSKFK